MPAKIPTATTFDGEEKATGGMTAFMNEYMNGSEIEADVYFVLFHVHAANERELGDINLALGEDCKEPAEEFWSMACDDAETRRGKSRYIIRPKGAKKMTRFLFVVDVKSEIDGDDEDFGDWDGEDSTIKGAFAQQMRHTEKATGQTIEMVKEVRHMRSEEMERLDRQLDRLTKENENLRAREQAVLDLQQKRDLEFEAFKKDQERKDKYIEVAMGLLPVLIQHFMAPKANPLEDRIRVLATTLSPQQKQLLLASMTPEQQNAFVDLLSSLQNGGGAPTNPFAALLGGLSGPTSPAPDFGSPPAGGFGGGTPPNPVGPG